MPSLSKQAIVDRVRIFAESIRIDTTDFMPGKTWWLLKETKASQKKYPDAILLLDQLGISSESMEKHFTTHWANRIGEQYFADTLRRGVDKQSIFVTVRSVNDNDSSNTSPLDPSSNVVGGRTKRNAPWKRLQRKFVAKKPPTIYLLPS